MAIKFHCSLNWSAPTKGSSQFEIPYFLFRPLRGHLIMEDSWKYRTDDDEIAAMGKVFDEIVRTGEITFPIPADETRAVLAMREANASRGKVTVLIGLLQFDQARRSKAIRVGIQLVNAGVTSLFTRQMKLTDPVSGTVTDKLYYIVSFKGAPAKNLKTMTAPA